MQHSKYCMFGAVSNLAIFGDYRQLHAWLVALVVAIVGTLGLELSGLVEVSGSSFRSGFFSLGGTILGGLVFGFGTALGGGCASRVLVRISEGNVGALLTAIAFGGTGMLTLFGVLQPTAGWFITHTSLDLPIADHGIAAQFGLSPILVAAVVVAICLLIIFTTGRSNRDFGLLTAGVLIGLLVVLTWWFTGSLAQDEFDPKPAFSLSISGPLSRTALLVTSGSLAGSWFGITLVFGIILGGFLSSLYSHNFHLVLPDVHHLPHVIIGGLLMGVGAALAGGCNIGQGLSGMSSLSLSSVLAVIGIFAGMRLGVAWLQREEG
jgi:hypothetical protein